MLMELFLTSFTLSMINGVSLLVSYVNNNSFPQPLSKEDELRCLQIIQHGHSNSDAALRVENIVVLQARNKLIDHNMRLVAHIVKRFDDKTDKKEDLFSIGMMGLIKAIDTFNPQKGAKLSTYAARCITNEILMDFRKNKHNNLETSLYCPIGQDKEGNEINIFDHLIADIQPIPDQIIDDEDQRILLENVQKLPTLCRQVLQMRYGLLNGLECSQQQIADLLGISRSYVSRIEKKAIKLLISYMKDRLP